MGSGGSSSIIGAFAYRVLGACVLDRGMYEGIEADRRPMVLIQAGLVVVLSSVAAGIGARDVVAGSNLSTFLSVTALALVTWIAWAVLMQQIGTKLMPAPQTRSDAGELLRTLGFAASPGMFQVFAFLPAMRIPVFAGAWLWMFAAMVVAVRQALDLTTTRRALVVCAAGAGIALALAVLIALLFTSTAASAGPQS